MAKKQVFFTAKNDYSDDDGDAVITKNVVAPHTDPTNGVATITLSATDTDIALAGDDKIVAVLKRDMKSTLGIIIAPEMVAMQRYERALPYCTLGHEHRVRRIEAETARIPGMFLAGNYLRGFSIGACVRAAEETAEQVTAYLEKNSELPRRWSASQ